MSRGGIVAVGLVAIIAGFGIVWQLRTEQQANSLTQSDRAARTALELVDLVRSREQLAKQRTELESKLTELRTSSEHADATRSQTVAQHESYEIVLATTAATGGGVRLTFTDKAVSSIGLIDLVNALKNLGAEAISIHGHRFGPTSSVDDGVFNNPLVVEVIGNSRLLTEGLRQSGGILDQLNVPVDLESVDQLTLPAR